MGYYRGVPQQKPSMRLQRIAAKMLERNLTQGSGCRSTARAIAKRTGAEVKRG